MSSQLLRVYAYLDGLDEIRLKTQKHTLQAWADVVDAKVLGIESEPFVKRMKFAQLEPILGWCRTFQAGIVVARTAFLATQARFLKRVTDHRIDVFSADLLSLRGDQGLRDSVKMWRQLSEISMHRSSEMSQAKRLQLSQRLTSATRQDEHDKELAEEVYFAVRNKLTDKALAIMLNERGRLQLTGNRYTIKVARQLRANVLNLLQGV